MQNQAVIAYVTCPDQAVAEKIAYDLVEQRAAACVNILPGLLSTYRWQGEVHTDPELLLMIKTTAQAFARVEAAVLARHPDELPEIVAVPIALGLNGYLDWIAQETTPE